MNESKLISVVTNLMRIQGCAVFLKCYKQCDAELIMNSNWETAPLLRTGAGSTYGIFSVKDDPYGCI